MTVTSKGAHGEPIIQNPPTRIPDMTAIAAYAAMVGNRIIGTSTQRGNFAAVYGFAPYPGLLFFETDTANEFVFFSAWHGTRAQTGLVAFASGDFTGNGGGFNATRTIAFVPGRFTAAPTVTTGVFTSAPQDQHAGVANVTATGFTLYYWRANLAATSVGWTATSTDDS